MMYSVKNQLVTLTASEISPDVFQLQGKVAKVDRYQEVLVMAANPIDRMMNYSGSGLPFPCPSIAFENTPNIFKVPESGMIDTIFSKPNSYYTGDTLKKVKPSIFIRFISKNNEPEFVQLELEDTLPLKTIFYRPERTGPEFYQRKADAIGVRSQEDILRMTKEVKEKYHCA